MPTYNELIFVARRKELDAEGRLASCGASCAPPRRATSACAQDPEVGVDALLKADTGLDRGLQAASVKATLPVFFPADTTSRSAGRTPSEWKAYGDWMHRQRLLKRPPARRRR